MPEVPAKITRTNFLRLPVVPRDLQKLPGQWDPAYEENLESVANGRFIRSAPAARLLGECWPPSAIFLPLRARRAGSRIRTD